MPPSAIDLRRGRVSEIGRIYLITAVTLDRVPLFEDLALARTTIAHLRHADAHGRSKTLAWVLMLRIPTIVTAHTDERDRCSVRASVVFRV